MRSAIYTGKLPELQGKRALIKKDSGTPDGKIEAQFDDMDLEDPRRPDAPELPGPKGKMLAFGWHRFPENDFA